MVKVFLLIITKNTRTFNFSKFSNTLPKYFIVLEHSYYVIVTVKLNSAYNAKSYLFNNTKYNK